MTAGATPPELPLLAPWYRLVEEGDAVVLEHAHRAVVFEGQAATSLLPRLFPLLDGTRSLAQLADALGPGTADAVANALGLLAREGLLVPGPRPDGPADAVEAAERLAAVSTVPPAVARERLAAARVGVVGSAGEDAARLLQLAGVGGVERLAGVDASGVDAVLAAPAAGELAALEDWNRAALARPIPWLQLLPFDGRLAAVGPLYLPGETACWTCYRLRRAGCLGFGALAPVLEASLSAAPAGPGPRLAAAAVAADLLLRWLALRDPRLPGVLHALVDDGGGLRLDGHHVLRVPRCPDCSPAAARAPVSPWFEAVA